VASVGVGGECKTVAVCVYTAPDPSGIARYVARRRGRGVDIGEWIAGCIGGGIVVGIEGEDVGSGRTGDCALEECRRSLVIPGQIAGHIDGIGIARISCQHDIVPTLPTQE
jgi:hypothetical protein